VSEGGLWVIGAGPAGAIGEARPIADDDPDSPSWQADSRHLVYLTPDGLRRVAPDEGQPEDITIGLGWQPQIPGRLIVHAGALFNGRTTDLVRNVDITIDKGRVQAIEPHRDELHAGTVIDASNETVMPGLIDMHAHLESEYGEGLGRALLAYGITSVRDPIASAYAGLELRDSYDAGRRIGPRVFLAGDPLTGVRVVEAGATPVLSEAQLQRELDRGTRLSYDFFSTYVRLPDPYLRRATEYAHAKGIAVASRTLFPAAAYGVDHLDGLREASRGEPSTRASARGASYRDVIDVIARSGVTLTPMIAADGCPLQSTTSVSCVGPMRGGIAKAVRDASWIADQRLGLLPAAPVSAFREQVEFLRTRPSEREKVEAIVLRLRQTVAAIVAAGGRVTAGSGSPGIPYGAGLHLELEHFVDAGLTPFRALQAAGVQAAQALGVDDELGSIEPGKLADLVIVGGDPLRDIQSARDVRGVLRGGRYYDAATLLRR
jgi:cytosine/adenosine deaminase-related metal-dependent hydrolase